MRKDISFEHVLERCLQELGRTDDATASVQRYPQYADRLLPLVQVAQASRRHYRAVPQPPGGLAAGRERLLAAAAQQRSRNTGTSSRGAMRKRRTLRLAFRTVAVLLVAILGLAGITGGVAWAASTSLPGDLLYPVKLTVEDVRLSLVSAPGEQVELALRLVEERGTEIQALVEDGQHVPDETLARMERHVERALSRAAWASDREMVGLLAQIAARTRTQEQELEQLQAATQTQARFQLKRAVTICQRAAQAAEDGLSDPAAFRWRYRAVQETPEPPRESESPTPSASTDHRHEQEQKRTPSDTPGSTPYITPQGPQPTPRPRTTPKSQATPRRTPQAETAPQEPQATPEQKSTPHGLQRSPEPKSTPQGSQSPTEPKDPPQGSQGPEAKGTPRRGP